MTQPAAAELQKFATWYAEFHGTASTEKSVFVTCLCGHFHTYPKAADGILKELTALRLAEFKAGKVRIL